MTPDENAPGPEPAETAGAIVAAPAGRRQRVRLSEIFHEIAQDAQNDRISVAHLLERLQDRAFGALMLVFAFPNILPSPPGMAGVLGLPLLFLSSQMMLGQLPWLPRFIARRSMTREAFQTLVGHAAPWLGRAERLLIQRLTLLSAPMAQRVIGALCLILSLVLVLPIPFGNLLPSAAICIIALGVLERDGLWVMGGVAAGAVAVAVVGGMAYAVIKSLIFVAVNAF